MFELPMVEGWAFYAMAMEHDGFLQFSGVRRSGEGYIAQEAKRLKKRHG